MNLRELFNQIAGNTSGIVFSDGSRIEGDPQTRKPDTARARAVLNWQPQIELEEGLKRTIRYFRSVLTEPA